MAAPTYKSIKNSRQTSSFGMNQVDCLIFGHEGKRYHLTEALNGCFGVFLVSPLATISAHIPPHPGTSFKDPQAGDKNLIVKMQKFAELYHSHQKYFSGYNVALVYAKFQGKTALPDKKSFIEKCLQKFNMDFPIQDYDVKSPGEPRRDEHGTAFVDGGASIGAILYLEDKQIMRVSKSSSDKVSPPTIPQTPTQFSNPIFPRPTPSSAPASSPISQAYVSNPIFPRTPSAAPVSIQASGPSERLRYVKSKADPKEQGARIVTTPQGDVLIKAELWKIERYEGKTVWVCWKHKVYTDL